MMALCADVSVILMPDFLIIKNFQLHKTSFLKEGQVGRKNEIKPPTRMPNMTQRKDVYL